MSECIYHMSPNIPGKGGFSKSKTIPGQGFRPKDLVVRMMAGAPTAVGRDPVYLDQSFGIDPLSRFEVPIEDLHEASINATKTVSKLKKEYNNTLKNGPPLPPVPPVIP